MPSPRPLTLPLTLTLLRILLVPVFLALLISARADNPGDTFSAHLKHEHLRWAALALFALLAVTDKLDGYLARRWNQTTRLGALLDPTADKLLLAASLVLLCFPRYAPDGFVIPWPVTLGAYLKDIGVIIGALVIRTKIGHVEIRASAFGKTSTVVQLSLVMATLLVPQFVEVSPKFTGIFFWCLWWATVLTAAAAAVDYSFDGARQLRNAVE